MGASLKEEELRELKGLEKEAKGALSVCLSLSLSLSFGRARHCTLVFRSRRSSEVRVVGHRHAAVENGVERVRERARWLCFLTGL